MGKKKDFTGLKFGRWTVIEEDKDHHYGRMWICLCDCGNKSSVFAGFLNAGRSLSCGCFRADLHTTHGQSAKSTPEYRSWRSMKARCLDSTHESYPDYGGRGITICPKWLGDKGFETFFLDMGSRPSEDYTLDRIDCNGNYEISNCRWATEYQQKRNRRNNIWYEYHGLRMIQQDWCNILKCVSVELKRRLKRGQPFDEIVEYYMIKKEAA